MKRKARITRLIITALIVSLAAILTALSPINPKETPSQASTEFIPIDNYVSARLHDLRIPGAALASSRMARSSTCRPSAPQAKTKVR